MIETILPAAAIAVEECDGPGGRSHPDHAAEDETPFPEEEAVIRDAVPKRRDEFRAVRRCARRALARLGHAPAPLLPGPAGAPTWPAGVVGSMTHCAGYGAAAVAERSQLSTLGIDAEADEPLPDGVLHLVARPDEITHLSAVASAGTFHADRLLFSAKESVYKAWYPLTQRWLDFDDVSVTIDRDGRRFDAVVLTPSAGPFRRYAGAWTVGSGLILTACVLAATA
ncbi:4'-phosphopantetheinyl transferase [Microbacterium testaceum]|uniref:4'-phosphopantetheinyl transferase family protein n=1 Tax=Microbacterium testaceum TaxID=2033 RepID=UPI00381075ED